MSVGDWRCRFCNTKSDFWSPRCPVRCRDGRSVPLIQTSLVLPGDEPIELAEPEEVFAKVSSVKPMDGQRISTGIPGMDRVLGEEDGEYGAHEPSVNLIAGPPGCGKTSLLLRMLANLQGKVCTVMASSEQPIDEIHSTLVRLGLQEQLRDLNIALDPKPPGGLIKPTKCLDINVLLAKACAAKVKVGVLDSINKICDPIRDTKELLKNKVKIMERIINDANENGRVWFVVSHMNKEDKVFGSLEMAHDCAAILLVQRVDGHPKHRLLQAPDKNRWGDTSEMAFFTMGKKGMSDASNPFEDEEPAYGGDRPTDGYPRSVTHVPLAVRIARRKEKEGR